MSLPAEVQAGSRGGADDVVVMRAGRIVESGPTATVLENLEHAHTKPLSA